MTLSALKDHVQVNDLVTNDKANKIYSTII